MHSYHNFLKCVNLFTNKIGWLFIAPFLSYSIRTYHKFTSHICFTISTFILGSHHNLVISPLYCFAISPFVVSSRHNFTISPITTFQHEIASLFHHSKIKPLRLDTIKSLQHCIIAFRLGSTWPKIKHLQYNSYYVFPSEFECFGQWYWNSAYLHES